MGKKCKIIDDITYLPLYLFSAQNKKFSTYKNSLFSSNRKTISAFPLFFGGIFIFLYSISIAMQIEIKKTALREVWRIYCDYNLLRLYRSSSSSMLWKLKRMKKSKYQEFLCKSVFYVRSELNFFLEIIQSSHQLKELIYHKNDIELNKTYRIAIC